MKKKQPNTQQSKNVQNNIKKLSSIKATVTYVLLGSIILTVILSLYIIIPSVQQNVTSITENYMTDLTDSYGRVLDQNIKISKLYLSTGRLRAVLMDIGLKGMDSSYFYVVSPDGIVLYHPSNEKIGKQVEIPEIFELATQLSSDETSTPEIIHYTYNKKIRYAAHYNVSSGKAILVLSTDKSEILEPVAKVAKRAFLYCSILAFALSISGYFMISKMTKPILTITDVIGNLATMNLKEDQRLLKISGRKDETGVMARAITTLQKELVGIISEIKEQSFLLYKTSEELNSRAAETSTTVQNVERAVSEIAAGATSQATETQKANEDILLMGNMVEETSSQVTSLNSTADSIKASSDTATQTLEQLDNINQRAINSINIIYEQTLTTNDSALKIKQATSLISSIAEETNLLSLNASIEAARAGDAGRGFAVVASQIQKLAEQSNVSAQQIDQIIFTLLEDSQKAVHTMKEVKEIITQQSENVSKTGAVFSEVKNGISDSIQGVGEIASHTNRLNSARSNIVDVVQNLTSIAEQNAASTEETSAAVMEVADVMQEISNHASKLQQIASTLETNVDTFQL
ncbi:methyl-accepting chemotaxis protein [Lachnospiraceae bacterium 66-29]